MKSHDSVQARPAAFLGSFHPAIRALVHGHARRPDRRSSVEDGKRSAAERTPYCGAHRLRQDARGVPHRARRPASARASTAGLPDEVRVIYVSPLKALSADIHKNLAEPRAAIRRSQPRWASRLRASRRRCAPATRRVRARRDDADAAAHPGHDARVVVPAAHRRAQPRAGCSTVRTVIVDEIHAVIGTRRGAHLALTLERLAARSRVSRCSASASPRRSGQSTKSPDIWSAPTTSIHPARRAARSSTPATDAHLDLGTRDPGLAARSRDVARGLGGILRPPGGAGRGASHDARLRQHAEDGGARRATPGRPARRGGRRARTTAASRRNAGWMPKKRLKQGRLKALVATASLELGIDIGHVDLVCQIGSPHRIATFLQRVGRAGHTIHGTPKGRLFPMTRDDLVECAALLHAVAGRARSSRLARCAARRARAADRRRSLDVATGGRTISFALVRRAWPYRDAGTRELRQRRRMLAEGFTTRRGRRGALIHRDEVQRRVTGRRSARLVAMTSGGAIPENADYASCSIRRSTFIGTLNEDFAIESNTGDIFQLGNRSWQVLQVGTGVVRVADAHGAPPSLPFWLGEAPARSAELSASVSELRRQLADRLVAGGPDRTTAPCAWLDGRSRPRDGIGRADRRPICAESLQILGVLPTAGHDRPRAVLRRIGRDATGAACAVRQPCQSRVGAGAPKALLPPVQLRAAGRRHRRMRCCCRSARSTRFRSPTCFATCTRTPSGTC